MNVTREDLFTVLMPLVVALHEKKLLDIAELPHYYEDALVRRKLDLSQDAGELAFLQETIHSLHRLAAVMKAAPAEPHTPPPA